AGFAGSLGRSRHRPPWDGPQRCRFRHESGAGDSRLSRRLRFLDYLGLGFAGLAHVVPRRAVAVGYPRATVARDFQRHPPHLRHPLLAHRLELPKLYSWAGPTPDWGAGEPSLLGFRKLYLSYGFFFGRMVFYFLFWGLLGWFLFRWSTEQDKIPGEPSRTLK